MLPDLLFVPCSLVYVAILCALFVYGANFIYLTVSPLRTGDRRPARRCTRDVADGHRAAAHLQRVSTWPQRLIDASRGWTTRPTAWRSRCSTTPPTRPSTIVAELVANWRDQGRRHHARPAGQPRGLQGRARCAHGLDARTAASSSPSSTPTSCPTPDFLRAAVPALVADPGLAFVQARWGHVNRDFSLLTRLQARRHRRALRHRAGRRAGRAGYCFNFNGTAGVWRRSGAGRRRRLAARHADGGPRPLLPRLPAPAGGPATCASVEAPAELPVSFERLPAPAASLGARQLRVRDEAPADDLAVRRAALAEGVGDAAPHRLRHPPAAAGAVAALPAAARASRRLIPSCSRCSASSAIFNLTTLAPTFLFAVGQRQVGSALGRPAPDDPAAQRARLRDDGEHRAGGVADVPGRAGRVRAHAEVRRPRPARRLAPPALPARAGPDRVRRAGAGRANAFDVRRSPYRWGYWAIGIYAAIFAIGLGTVAGASIRQTLRTGRAQRHAAAAGRVSALDIHPLAGD